MRHESKLIKTDWYVCRSVFENVFSGVCKPENDLLEYILKHALGYKNEKCDNYGIGYENQNAAFDF